MSDASSHNIPACSCSSTNSVSSRSTSTEITNAFISASLKPFRVVTGQLTSNISIYQSTSIIAGVIAKIKPPKKQKMADLGLGHDYHLTTSAFQMLLLFPGYFYLSSLQKSFSLQNTKIAIPFTVCLLSLSITRVLSPFFAT